jgi:hypothetical protein
MLDVLAGLSVFAISLSMAGAGAAQPISVSRIEFSSDLKKISIVYDKGSGTLQRPVVPPVNYVASGRIYWVAPTGVDTNGGSATKPLKTISKGIALARPGDVVYVKAGTYTERITITKSGSAASPIIISVAPGDIGHVRIRLARTLVANNPGTAVVRFENGARHVWFNGFVIEGYRGWPESPSNDDYGANGVTWSGGAGLGTRLTNNVIFNNLHCGVKEMNHGGTSILIAGNVIFENGTDGLDHGIYAPANEISVDGNIVFYNSGWGVHSYPSPVRQTLTRNILFFNGSGGILLAGSETRVFHNLALASRKGILYFRGGSAFNKVLNNIFAFNTETDGGYDNGGGKFGNPHDNLDDFNCYSSPPDPRIKTGLHEVYGDPRFVDAARGDFRLQPASRCIDAGTRVGFPYSGAAPDPGVVEYVPAN